MRGMGGAYKRETRVYEQRATSQLFFIEQPPSGIIIPSSFLQFSLIEFLLHMQFRYDQSCFVKKKSFSTFAIPVGENVKLCCQPLQWLQWRLVLPR